MTRLRGDCLIVARIGDRLAVTSSMNCFAVTSHTDCISVAKGILALLVSFSLLTTPVWAAPASSLGTVVYADRAHVGAAQASVSVGATIFTGDRLSTDQSGSVQIRAGAARLLLSSASIATFSQDDVLHVGSAVIRPNTNQPTIGQVTVLTSKELIVKSTRGSLSIAVEDDVREIPEGAAYRVVLDPSAADPQGPRGAGTKGYGGPPIKAAKSKFMWYVIGVTAVVTVWAFHEVFESPDRP